MFLGIEIGGTKLQAGVGTGDGEPLLKVVRCEAQPSGGAAAILAQTAALARPLLERYRPQFAGIGFGGPVDVDRGRTIRSHQVQGWEDFPLADWFRENLRLPAVLSNDSDAAGLAEARFGAGRGSRVVFYNNIGSGIGGALVVDEQLYRGGSGVASELGHLRPGLHCDTADQTVESIASGWAITQAARRRIEKQGMAGASELLSQCEGDLSRLDTRMIARAAMAGEAAAREAFDDAARVVGWALAQMITLVAPNVVVLGGGVSLVGEELWLAPIRRYVERYVFPPAVGSYAIVPAQLGEEVVLHGAIALAARRSD